MEKQLDRESSLDKNLKKMESQPEKIVAQTKKDEELVPISDGMEEKNIPEVPTSFTD